MAPRIQKLRLPAILFHWFLKGDEADAILNASFGFSERIFEGKPTFSQAIQHSLSARTDP
jgi:hypothetical protein